MIETINRPNDWILGVLSTGVYAKEIPLREYENWEVEPELTLYVVFYDNLLNLRRASSIFNPEAEKDTNSVGIFQPFQLINFNVNPDGEMHPAIGFLRTSITRDRACILSHEAYHAANEWARRKGINFDFAEEITDNEEHIGYMMTYITDEVYKCRDKAKAMIV